MLYVIQCKPLVTALAIWSLLCLVVVPLSAQNILVMPGMDLLSSLQFAPEPFFAAVEYPSSPAPLRFSLKYGGDSDDRGRLELTVTNNGTPAHEENCRRFTEIKKIDENQHLRDAWREAFGFDVWYPYYKEKEIEGWVRQKFRVRILRLKGEPQFSSKGFTYIFKSIF